MTSKKYQVICANREAGGGRAHAFFTWASDIETAVGRICPTCYAEGIEATECRKDRRRRRGSFSDV